MARKTITINDNSDKRVQTEFSLNPVNLSPTVNSGGRYSVALQETPKTNAALNLANNLKKGVQTYGQVVDYNQKRATEDVATMTDAEYNQFLEQGLDPEAKSIFGYTKAYNRQLAQKYYAEEIPKKLQDVSASMFNNYYEYKDLESFESALTEKTKEIYSEADTLLGGNPFGDEANRVLKNATQNDFITKERTKFLNELPKRNKALAQETIDRSIMNIDADVIASGNLFSVLDEVFGANVGVLGAPNASQAINAAVINRLEALIISDSSVDNALAEEILDELGDGKTEGEVSKKIGGQDLFNTSSRQNQLQKLEQNLEDKKDKALENAREAIAPRLLNFQADLISNMNAGGTEADTKKKAQDRITYLNSEDGLAEYPNDLERSLEIIGLQEILNNTKLFKNEYANNYQATNKNNLLYRNLVDGIDNKIPSAFKTPNPLSPSTQEVVGLGIDYQNEAAIYLDQLYIEAANATNGIKDTSQKLARFKELEKEIPDALDSWSETWWSSRGEQTNIEQERKSLYEEVKVFNPEYASLNEDNPKNLQAAIDDQNDKATKESLKGTKGTRTVRGFRYDAKIESFYEAGNANGFEGDEQIANFNQLHGELDFGEFGKQISPRISRRGYLIEVPRLEQIDLAQGFAFKVKLVGLDSQTLADGLFFPNVKRNYGRGGVEASQVSVQEFFDLTGLKFDEFPIVLNGDIKNTINAVEAYQADPEGSFVGNFRTIANKYGLTLDELMVQQRQYLTENGYIKSN